MAWFKIEKIQVIDFALILDLVAERVAIEGLKAAFYWPRDLLKEELMATSGFIAVGEDGKALAFCLYRDLKFDWEISCLATAYGAEGQGVMRALLSHLLLQRTLETSTLTPSIRVFLEVHILNTRAQRLYEGLGFQKISERKSYYRDGASAFVYLA